VGNIGIPALGLPASPGLPPRFNYEAQVKALLGSALTRYFPMDESSGAVGYDRSGNAGNGAYVTVTLADTPAPRFTRTRAPFFNGLGSTKLNVYSAAFNAIFNGHEGAFGIWLKNDQLWSTTNPSVFGFQADNNNRIFARTGGGSDQLNLFYIGGGVSIGSLSLQKLTNFTDWMELWFSWSDAANEFIVFCNGVICEWQKYNGVNFPLALTGVWTGNLDPAQASIGTYSAIWKGWLAHARLLNRPVTAAEVRALNPYPVILFDGDSRTNGKTYPFEAFGASQKTWYGFKHQGTSGASVAVLLAAAPGSVDTWRNKGNDICIIWTGINDSASTAQQIHDALKGYCLARKAAGWRVVICTEIDAQDAGRLANGWPAKYLALNTLLRADFTDFADGLADLGANVNLQDATNTTYFLADKVHLTAAGYTQAAGVVGAVLEAL